MGGQPVSVRSNIPQSPTAAAIARNAAGVVVVTQFQAGHGWVFGGGVTGGLNETTGSPAVGTQYAWLQNVGDNAVKNIRKLAGTAYDLTNYDIGLQIRVDNPDQFPATGASMLLYVGNTSFANFITYAFNVDGSWKTFPKRNTYSTNFGGSWQHITLPTDPGPTLPAAYSAKTGAQTAAQILANVTDWQLYCKDKTGGVSSRVSIQEVYLVPKQTTYANGVCCLTFDDGYASNLSIVAPMLAAVGGRATTYVIRDALGAGLYLSVAQLKTLQDTYNWRVGVHANLGTDHVSPGFPALTASAGITDVQNLRAWFAANGFVGYNHMAYPNGGYCVEDISATATNDQVDVTLAPYVKTARTILNKCPETLPPGNRMLLRTYLSTSAAMTLATVKAAADTAKRQKSVMIVTFHEIVASSATSAQWLTADLQALVTYIDSLGMPMRTIDEVFG
jgi:peptidoglycan/xylan/chitin deacetylase (PgdA/CDA1 family)